ncbi:MAG: hypothetical protein DBX57_05320 [Clostridia bacterium]|nr:MAG: hypothetical protein DBX57_05320 [Clostridia bacterium]
MKRRLLASILAFVIVLGLLPTAALAKNVSDLGENMLTGYIPIGATGTVNGGDRALKNSNTVSYAIAKNDDGTYTLTLSGGAIPSYKTENPVVAKDGTVGNRLTDDTANYPNGYVLDENNGRHEVPSLTEDPYRYSTETGCYYQTLPWYASNDISKVVFEDSVTAIGSNVLDHMPNLTEIEIKNSSCVISSGAISYYAHLPQRDVVIKASAGVKGLDRMISAKSDDMDAVNTKVTFSYYEAEDFIQKNASIWTLTKANAEENRTEIEAAYSAYLALPSAAKNQIDETAMPDAEETYGAHVKTLAQSLKTYIPLKLDEQGNTVYSDTVWYTLENGVLTFDGTGALPNYTAASDTSSFMYNATPWWSAKEQVNKVVVKSGITSVGALSLAHLIYASEIVIEGETTKVLSNSISYNYLTPKQKVTIKCWSSNPYVLEKIDGYSKLSDKEKAWIHIEYQDVANFVATHQNLWTIGEKEELTDAQKSEIWAAYATYNESNATFQAGLANVNGENYAEKLSALNTRAGKQPAEKKYIPIGRDSEGNDICSKTVWYTIEDGVLTFGGAGEIPDYDTQFTATAYHYNAVPWYKVRDTITRVVVEKEVTKVGHLALCHMKNLTSVEFLNPNLALSSGAISYYRSAPEENVVYHVYAATGFVLGTKYFDGWDLFIVGKAEDKISISYYEAENFVKAYNALWDLVDAESHASEIKAALKELEDLPDAAKTQLATDTIADTGVTYVSKLSQLMADLNLGGKCGEHAEYALRDNEDGKYTLQITGSGDLYDYTSGKTPWASYSDKITDVTVDSGITKLTSGAFRGLTVLKSVDLPESDLEIENAAFPDAAFILYGYSNHASGRYAEAHKNVQLKLKSLRILAMGNSHTVDYTQFVENVLKDIDQDVATKITVERLTPMGGRGLTIDQGDRGNHFTSAHNSKDSKYQDYRKAFAKTWDVVVMQDYHESSSEKYGGAKYATEIQKAVEWLHEDAKGAKIVWFADWAEKSSNQGDLQKTYALSMQAVKAVQALETNKPDYIIPAATVLQNARTTYLGTTKNRSDVLLNNYDAATNSWAFGDCAKDKMSTYTVLERDATHMSLELGRQLMATNFVYQMLTWFGDKINTTDTFNFFDDLKTAPVYEITSKNVYWQGEFVPETWAIIKEACENAKNTPYSVKATASYTTDPFLAMQEQVKQVLSKVALPETMGADTLKDAFSSADVLAKLNAIDGRLSTITADDITASYTAPVNGTVDNPLGTDGSYEISVNCHYGYSFSTAPLRFGVIKASHESGYEQELEAMKAKAIAKIQNYMANDSYAEGDARNKVIQAKADCVAAIQAATSTSAVTEALKQAESIIDDTEMLFLLEHQPDAVTLECGQIWSGGWNYKTGTVEKNNYTLDYLKGSTEVKDSTFTGVWWVIYQDSKTGEIRLEFSKDKGTGYSFTIPDYNANHWLDKWHAEKSYNPLQYNKTPWFTKYGQEITTVVFDDGITVGQYATACLRNVKEYKIGDQVTLNPYVIFFNTLQTNTKITFNNSAIVKEDAISAYNVQDSYPYYVDVYGNLSKVTTADGTKLEGNLRYAFGEYQEHATAFNTKTGIKEIIATGIDGAPHYTGGVPDGTKMLRVFNTNSAHRHTEETLPAVTGCAYDLSAGTRCSACGAIVEKQTVTKGTGAHQWVLENTDEPTVDKEGYKTYTCSVCHVEKVESIPATAVARIVNPATKEVKNYDKVEDAVKAAAGQVGTSGTTDVTVNLVPGYNLPDGTTGSGVIIDKDEGTIKVTGPNASITVPVHSFSKTWNYDETNHWHACTVEGHTDKNGLEPHAGGTATCTEQAICSTCGQKYGELAKHTLKKTETKAATCTATGNSAYWTCDVCGKFFSDENGETGITENSWVIPASGHTWSTVWSKNETTHWHECTNCHAKNDEAAHTPGPAATEEQPQTCTECGYELNPELGHQHKLHLTPVAEKAATCKEAGNIAYWCCKCGNLFKDADATVSVTAEQVITPKDLTNHVGGTEVRNAKDATYTEEGYTGDTYCLGCNTKLTSGTVIPKLMPAPTPVIPVTPSEPAKNPFNPDAGKAGFADVSGNVWYASAVNYVVDKGLMNGTGEDKFSPNADTTRGMIVTVLARLDGKSTAGTPWFAAGQRWAMEYEISDGTNMTGAITREQLVAMLFRYAVKNGLEAVTLSENLTQFTDASDISAWAVSAMQWAVGQGLIQGSNGQLHPQANASRAEVATILMRFCELMKK